jgi:hypothetical protein
VSEEKDTSQKRTWRDRFSRGRDKRPMTPERRRLLLIVGIAVLVIAVFVIVPSYVASQPSYLQRYSNYHAEYQTWSTSVHAQVPCQRCHVAPNRLAQVGYNVRMLGEFYVSIVARSRQPKLLGTPVNAACSSCHIDLRTVSPSGDLNIPHRAHVVVLNIPCVQCHSYLVHQKSPEGTHTPRMVACLKCHDGTQAKNSCSTCHTNKAAPASHRSADWVIVHPQAQTAECRKCHQWTANWCAQCHAKRPKSHTADWRTKHGEQVKVRRNCEACHVAAFCVRCHGDVPQLNFNPALKLVQ